MNIYRLCNNNVAAQLQKSMQKIHSSATQLAARHYKILPILALLLTNIIWGAAAPIFKWALLDMPPFTFAFIRFAIAGGILFPYLFTKPIHLSMRQMSLLCFGAFIGFTVRISMVYLGLQRLSSMNWSLIASIGPVMMFFVSILFLKERFHARKLIGMSLALMGAVVVIVGPLLSTEAVAATASELEGVAYVVIMMICTVIYTLLHRRISAHIEPIQLIALSFVFAAVTFFPLALFEWQTYSITSLTLPAAIGLFYAVVFASLIAYYCYIYGITHIDAQEIGIFSYVDPLAAFIVAMPLLHEQPSIWTGLGALIIFGGIYLSERRLHMRVKREHHSIHHRM